MMWRDQVTLLSSSCLWVRAASCCHSGAAVPIWGRYLAASCVAIFPAKTLQMFAPSSATQRDIEIPLIIDSDPPAVSCSDAQKGSGSFLLRLRIFLRAFSHFRTRSVSAAPADNEDPCLSSRYLFALLWLSLGSEVG